MGQCIARHYGLQLTGHCPQLSQINMGHEHNPGLFQHPRADFFMMGTQQVERTHSALPFSRGPTGPPGQYVDYAASKGAVDTFTIGLAKEVAAEGIRVNAVRPGIIETDIHASGGLPDRARDLAPQVPMQRAGSAQEVAQAIVWLMSADSSYTTGAMLDVAGGR